MIYEIHFCIFWWGTYRTVKCRDLKPLKVSTGGLSQVNVLKVMWIIFLRSWTQIKMVQVNSRSQVSLEFQSCFSNIQSSPKYSSTSSSSLSPALWLSNNSPLTALDMLPQSKWSFFMIPTAIWQWLFFNLYNLGSFHQVGHSIST